MRPLLVWCLRSSLHNLKSETADPSTPFGAKSRQTSLRMTLHFFNELLRRETRWCRHIGRYGSESDWAEEGENNCLRQQTAGSFGCAQDRLFACALAMKLREASLRMTISIEISHLRSIYRSIRPSLRLLESIHQASPRPGAIDNSARFQDGIEAVPLRELIRDRYRV